MASGLIWQRCLHVGFNDAWVGRFGDGAQDHTHREQGDEVVHSQRDGNELVNAAASISRVADRFSSHWDYNENGAADGDDVFTLIDHILLSKELATGLKRAFICHANSLEISDHFPVVVDLDFSLISSGR